MGKEIDSFLCVRPSVRPSVRPCVRAAVRPDTFGDSVFENFKSIVFFGEFFVQSPSKSLVATLAAAEMGAPFGLQNATCHISGYTNGSFAWSPQCYLPHSLLNPSRLADNSLVPLPCRDLHFNPMGSHLRVPSHWIAMQVLAGRAMCIRDVHTRTTYGTCTTYGT